MQDDPLQKALTACLTTGKKYIDLAIQLIKDGAVIDPQSAVSWGLFVVAVNNNRTDLAKLLTEKGLTVNAKDPETENTTLHFAAKAGNLDVAKYLVEQKADVSTKNIQKKLPVELLPKDASPELKTLLKKPPFSLRR